MPQLKPQNKCLLHKNNVQNRRLEGITATDNGIQDKNNNHTGNMMGWNTSVGYTVTYQS
jgi:hypothetical protein